MRFRILFFRRGRRLAEFWRGRMLEFDRHGLYASEALVGAIFRKPGRLGPRPDERHWLLAAGAAGHLRRVFVRHRVANALRLILVASGCMRSR
jgi:hypothetical protein